MDYSEQYDKIYRYCYYRLHHRETAEDITQETLLRFFEHKEYHIAGKELLYLYTIARRLCIDECRRVKPEPLPESELTAPDETQGWVDAISLRQALAQLDEDDRELILLRYVNEVPIQTLCAFYHISRFAMHRKIKKILHELKAQLAQRGGRADG